MATAAAQTFLERTGLTVGAATAAAMPMEQLLAGEEEAGGDGHCGLCAKHMNGQQLVCETCEVDCCSDCALLIPHANGEAGGTHRCRECMAPEVGQEAERRARAAAEQRGDLPVVE